VIRVFIGFDPRETVAYNVLAHSICARATRPVSITPIALPHLGGVYRRDHHALQSTDFSFSRFLTPYLSGFEGWSLFMDCDMLVQDDIARLWDERDERYALQVVKHNHVPSEATKFLGATQTRYEKKNWSSVMLFNNARCCALTPDYVNEASGLQLHQFKWLESDDLVGEIPHRWNHLVGYDAQTDDVSLLHYTEGGPYFHEYTECEYAELWRREMQSMLYVQQRGEAQRASA